MTEQETKEYLAMKKRLERAEQLLEQWIRTHREKLRRNANVTGHHDPKATARYFESILTPK